VLPVTTDGDGPIGDKARRRTRRSTGSRTLPQKCVYPDVTLGSAGVVAGVDEAGRGPLAGPVVAGAVVLDIQRPIDGIADSKRLSPRRRVELAAVIRERARAWNVAEASAAEVDTLNILEATLLAMQRAVEALGVTPSLVLVDGNRCPDLLVHSRAVIGGDATVVAIGAASIIAKVTRDEIMMRMEREYPGYGFERHKGYPTAEHLRALEALGPSPIHRHTFAPVRALLGAR